MAQIVGVRFKRVGKIYYFSPDDLNINKDDHVIVETARGIEFGTAVVGIREIPDNELIQPLKKVLRIATQEDIDKYNENVQKEKEAFDICSEKITKHKLQMKLVDVEYTFDNNKILFYFTAEGRVDFRELVKDLASIFRTRIELRQIGVRDEAKMTGSIGICGRMLCCNSFLGEFQPVSIKMAKEQGLSLNPSKISGACGRLMCCLKYEHEAYEYLIDKMPSVGSVVSTPMGDGEIISIELIKERVKVKLETKDGTDTETFDVDDIKVLRKTGSAKPQTLLTDDEEVDINELKHLED
ncbi:MAG TPA: stage 0 sporulation protein [Clostridiales bacterium]|nr:stage 0 sporulation protein [Clostridiales bacterium]